MHHDLNEKASKHETELIWLAWELEQMLLLKANNKTNGDRSLNLFIFSGFVSWKANLVFQFTRNRQFTKKLYHEHEPRLVLHCDQRTEFKGEVKILEKYFKIKIIRSSPYYHQSQGKIGRGYRTFHINCKIAEEVPKYQRVLKEDPSCALGYLAPFHVYCGRKSYFYRKPPKHHLTPLKRT